MRDYYQSQLDSINKNLIDMGLLLEDAIQNSILCLKSADRNIINAASKMELDIERMEKDLEGLCLNVILRQQPVAGDFRFVSSVLKMITDMKRIGNITEDIAMLSAMIKACRNSMYLNDIIAMGKITVQMLKNSIDAYVNRNIESAFIARDADDEVDEYFDSVKEQLIAMIKSDARGAEEAPDLLMIAKYFERLGDHCVNVAEWVIYAFTGRRGGHLDSFNDIKEATKYIQ